MIPLVRASQTDPAKHDACLRSGHSIEEVLKLGALSANTVTEEPIDVVLFDSYPDAVSLGLCSPLGLSLPACKQQLKHASVWPELPCTMAHEHTNSTSSGFHVRVCMLPACFCAPQKNLKDRYKLQKYVPFNPVDKFTCATLLDTQTNKVFRLLKGSPQVSPRGNESPWESPTVGRWESSLRGCLSSGSLG